MKFMSLIATALASLGTDVLSFGTQSKGRQVVDTPVQSVESAKKCLTAAEQKRLRRIERNKKIQEKDYEEVSE